MHRTVMWPHSRYMQLGRLPEPQRLVGLHGVPLLLYKNQYPPVVEVKMNDVSLATDLRRMIPRGRAKNIILQFHVLSPLLFCVKQSSFA